MGVLDDIKKLMDDKIGERLNPKAPAVEPEAVSEPVEEGTEIEALSSESEAPVAEEQGEADMSKLTPEEQMQLQTLYEKMCG